MQDDNRDELTPEQRALMDSLPRAVEPPRELEDRVVDALRARGAIRSRPAWRRLATVAAIFVLVVPAAYLVGERAGSRRAAPVSVADGRAIFALVVLDPVTGMPPEQTEAAVADAASWANRLGEAGILVGAEKLRDDGGRLQLQDGVVRLVADFPPPGDRLVIGGFFLVRAADAAEAQRIAADCPLLRYGSIIEVRELDDV